MEKLLTIRQFRMAEENFQLSMIEQGIISKKEDYKRIKSNIVQTFVNMVNGKNTKNPNDFWDMFSILENNGFSYISNTYWSRKFNKELDYVITLNSDHSLIIFEGYEQAFDKWSEDFDYNEYNLIKSNSFYGNKKNAYIWAEHMIEKANGVRERFGNS